MLSVYLLIMYDATCAVNPCFYVVYLPSSAAWGEVGGWYPGRSGWESLISEGFLAGVCNPRLLICAAPADSEGRGARGTKDWGGEG